MSHPGLDGRVVLVTGASRGIGAATALECARQGALLVLVARSTAESPHRAASGTLDEVRDEARRLGAEVLTVQADVSDERDVARAARLTTETFGRCDVLVNNAAASFVGPFLDLTTKRWDTLMAVNVRGPALMSRAVLPGMVERGQGSIINITSTGGSGAEHPDLTGQLLAYNVSKAALNRFTTGLATEMRPAGVAVNAVEVQAVTAATLATLDDIDPTLERPEAPAEVIAWIARQPATTTGVIFDQAEVLRMLRGAGLAEPTR